MHASCQKSYPANIDVSGFISLVRKKLYTKALKLHRGNNPFTAIYVCACILPCENQCHRTSLRYSCK